MISDDNATPERLSLLLQYIISDFFKKYKKDFNCFFNVRFNKPTWVAYMTLDKCTRVENEL